MTFQLTFKSFFRGLGWLIIALFWIVFCSFWVSLLQTNDTSAVGTVIVGLAFIVMSYFPLLFVPIGILAFGMRLSKAPWWKALYLWGTIAVMTYLALLLIAAKTLAH